MTLRRGHRALRRGRVSLRNQVYFLTFVVRHRENIFHDFFAGCLVTRMLSTRSIWRGGDPLAWVLMPDHWHGLVSLEGSASLSSVVNAAKSRTAVELNRAIGRSGSLWERAFYDHALRREEDMRAVARYIVANPLRNGLVSDIGDYPFWGAVWL